MGKSTELKKYQGLILISSILLIILAFSSLFIGKYTLFPQEIFQLLEQVPDSGDGRIKYQIFFEIRFPRIILSIIVGACLAISGTTLQALLHNPLASPDILGTSSGAGFGAALGILLFKNYFLLVNVLSLGFGLFSMFLVLLLSGGKKNKSVVSIVLSGIIVSSIFISLISLIKYIADTNETLPAITFWLMGSFSGSTNTQISIVLVPAIIGCFVLYKLRWKLNLLSLGDEEASMMGIDPQILRIILIIVSTVLISISVTVSGIIGWVGLVIPHICRRIIGANNGFCIPLSAVFGAMFMLIIDTIARSVSSTEIPIGILTALVGAPLFVFMFNLKKQR